MDLERLRESRPLLTLRDLERLLLSLDLERDRDLEREAFFTFSGDFDFPREPSRDLERDLDRGDFDRLLLRDLLFDLESRRPRDRLRDFDRDLEEDLDRFPRPPLPRSSTNRIRRPFSSVSSSFSIAAFKSE